MSCKKTKIAAGDMCGGDRTIPAGSFPCAKLLCPQAQQLCEGGAVKGELSPFTFYQYTIIFVFIGQLVYSHFASSTLRRTQPWEAFLPRLFTLDWVTGPSGSL